MRVLLISANRTEINMRTIPLGLACVAQAARQEGHEVQLLDLVQTKDITGAIHAAIGETKPEVIGISIRNIDDQSMRNPCFLFDDNKQVISLVREYSQAPIILGGAGYSMYPDAILDKLDADIGIEGEGEAAFNAVLRRLEKGETLEGLPGVHIKGMGLQAPRLFIRNPDTFMLPQYDLMLSASAANSDLWVPVQTRRGCPMACSYCSTGMIEGTIIRKRTPRSVVDWLMVMNERGIRQFYFVDNTFNLPPSYAMTLCREMICAALSLRWQCILYPFRLDEALIAAMAEAGCFEVSLGFESANKEVLKRMNKRFRRDDVAVISCLLKRYGIRQMGFLLLGGPGEARESVEESLEFAESLDIDLLKVTTGIRIYPGTALAEQARREGIIASDDNLLMPRFYITPRLEEGRIREIVERYAERRQNWIINA